MSEANFDFQMAAGLVLPYDGEIENLLAFIESCKLLDELTPTSDKSMAVKFIKTRITGKARVNLQKEFTSVDEIIRHVEAISEKRESFEYFKVKLSAIERKKSQSLLEFCEEIELLTNKLAIAYQNVKMHSEMALKAATSAGVDALYGGVHNNNIRRTLNTSKCETIEEAVTLVLKMASEVVPVNSSK